jgi:hypothetical protein
LNLQNYSISPNPLPGILPHRDAIKQLKFFLAGLQGLQVFPNVKKDHLTKVLRTIKIIRAKDSFNLLLLRKFRGKIGWFVYNDKNRSVYEVGREVSRLFFARPQNYWQKAVVPGNFQAFTLQRGNIKLELQRDKTWFLATNKMKGVEQQQVERLAKFLTRQADMVELKVPSEKLQQEIIFYITVSNHRFAVIVFSGEIILWDQSRSMLFHYWVGDKLPFARDIESYLE